MENGEIRDAQLVRRTGAFACFSGKVCVPLNSGDVCCDLISYICFCTVVSFPLLFASLPSLSFFLFCLHAASCVFLLIVGDGGLLRAFIDIDCMLFCAFEECLLVIMSML